jgi:hypothetical protein
VKNKNVKGDQVEKRINIIGDQQVEFPMGNKPSWLTSSIGCDKSTHVRQGRSMASEIFVQTQIFPLIEDQETVDEAKLVSLLVDFKRSRKDLDIEFEMAQVMARILSRFQCHLINEADGTSSLVSDPLSKELEVFFALAELDFQRIDDEVRNQLHFG